MEDLSRLASYAMSAWIFGRLLGLENFTGDTQTEKIALYIDCEEKITEKNSRMKIWILLNIKRRNKKR